MKRFAKIVNGSQNTSSQKFEKVLSTAVFQLAQNQEFRYTLDTYDTSINTWFRISFPNQGTFFNFQGKETWGLFPTLIARLYLNFYIFCFTFLHCNPLSPCLHKRARLFSWRHKTSLVPGIVLFIRFNISTRKISNLLLHFGGQSGRGLWILT